MQCNNSIAQYCNNSLFIGAKVGSIGVCNDGKLTTEGNG